ncbi:MAG: ribonuclease G [Rhodobacteraceae bacterium]|jgi:ribonuclease G|uniref:Ribonuclease, Rne/Rng family n=1 Tax=Salipiger profundus TaxID=1229727 RepID=A0A1U7D0M1_9RHOB|nr:MULTISPECIES: ribonuclease E/G [Salipiger]APX21626.1 ribonuclease, Rne/Rng family [Salipiger profundus]MAB08330.1 ribonuclease G [Paracoccaceae bacterium]GGA01020.1 ribonuclease G [Salipiger profundus]SFC12814.1 ribonuclease, Rne/Rng family [Salipiger profundus]
MKGRTIALDTLGEAEAAALIVDGQLQDLLVDSDHPRPGTIYRAVALRPVKGQGGMFLTTPDGNAFLRQVKGLAPGDRLLVQVTGFAEPGKAIPVTTRLLFKSRYAIVTPGAPGINVSRQIKDDDLRDELLGIAHEVMEGDNGLILRSSCAEADADDIAEDIAAMADLAAKVTADTAGEAELLVEGDGPQELAWREWGKGELDAEPGSFERHDVHDMIEALRTPVVPLSGGGSMCIEPTRALVAVDVNTGNDTSPAAGLKANMSALRELPRQLRLRGLGGQILVDPAPAPKKDRRQMEQVLRAALKQDATETVLAGWTQLGLIELQRKRERVPLREVLT